ncbi:hypothetical protein CMUST_09910 [Corynebacterium mustelae]|uniref:Uncharacterized protein n=1 Tax=Corynebacterium mustelae TaxID=571915 RepID=A0A0G3H3A7_9CORY|nr:hypothetical protein CMUST_09910 [Corynebacterium mustelae]
MDEAVRALTSAEKLHSISVFLHQNPIPRDKFFPGSLAPQTGVFDGFGAEKASKSTAKSLFRVRYWAATIFTRMFANPEGTSDVALSATELKNKLTETWPKQHWWTFDEQAQEFVTDAEVVFCVEKKRKNKYQLIAIFYVGPHGYIENVEDHNKTYTGDFETITEQIRTEAATTFQIMGYPMHWANITVEDTATTIATDRTAKLNLSAHEAEALIGEKFTMDMWRYDEHTHAAYSTTNIEFGLRTCDDEPGIYEEEESYYDGYGTMLLDGEGWELSGTPEEVAAHILSGDERWPLYGYSLKWPYKTIYIDDEIISSPWIRIMSDPRWRDAPELKQTLLQLNGVDENVLTTIESLRELTHESPLTDLAIKAVVENCMERGVQGNRAELLEWLISIRPAADEALQDEIFLRLAYMFLKQSSFSDTPRVDFLVTWVPKKRVPWLVEVLKNSISDYNEPDFNAPYFEALDALGIASEKEQTVADNQDRD